MKMKKIARPAFVLLLATVAIAEATTRLVPDQYATIQAAIDDCNDGDVVIVAPGTYRGDGNRDIDFKGKAIIVKSEAGAETCVIDCQGSWGANRRGFYFHSSEDASSILQGFTIMNGYVGRSGGGIYCDRSSPYIKDCLIVTNVASSGGGIACVGSNSVIVNCVVHNNSSGDGGGMVVAGDHPIVSNSIITGNRVKFGAGGGVYCGGNPVFVNCVVYGNRADSGGGIKCGAASGDKRTMRNCIVWGNTAQFAEQIVLGDPGIVGAMRLEIRHSVVENGPNAIVAAPPDLLEGEWISVDPLFVRPGYWDPNGTPDIPGDDLWVHGDYHLKSQAGRWDPDSKTWVRDEVTSPCIDAGDPKNPIGHEPFPNGGRINMGAYGGTAEASKSYFGEPICETIVAGDLNGDCKVDFADLMLMAAHWLNHKGRSPAPSDPPPEPRRPPPRPLR